MKNADRLIKDISEMGYRAVPANLGSSSFD